jgi:hypothetical protein
MHVYGEQALGNAALKLCVLTKASLLPVGPVMT